MEELARYNYMQDRQNQLEEEETRMVDHNLKNRSITNSSVNETTKRDVTEIMRLRLVDIKKKPNKITSNFKIDNFKTIN